MALLSFVKLIHGVIARWLCTTVSDAHLLTVIYL